MKYLNFFLAVVLLTVMVATPSLAGKGSGVASAPGVTAAGNLQVLSPQEGEIRQERAARSAFHNFDESTSIAIPQIMDLNAQSAAKMRSMFSSGLSGTYTIPGDFARISDAVAVLNFVGLSGDATFELTSTSYTEFTGITFGDYDGNDDYTLTVSPAAGVAATVNFQASSTNGKGFSFSGAKNVTIDGVNDGGSSLELKYDGGSFPSADLYAATIYITGNSNGITVSNCTINGNIDGPFETQTGGRAAVFIYGATGEYNENITIDGNTIINATYGFKSLQQFTAPAFFVSANNVWFTNNKVGGAFGGKVLQGILTEATFGIHVDNNVFDGIEVNDYYWNNGGEYDALRTFASSSFFYNFGQYSAIHVYNVDLNSTVLNNQIWDVHLGTAPGQGFLMYGITFRISNGGRGLIANNRVTGISNPDALGQTIGLRISNQNVYHNTVRLTGDYSSAVGAVSTCLNNDGASVIQNNVFSNEITGAGTTATRGVNASTVVNYSAIYSTGRYTTSGTGLAAAVAGGTNPGGTFGPVYLTSDLHVDTTMPSSASNVGAAAPGVAAGLDLDGIARDASTPDAGVDEFGSTPAMAVDVVVASVTAPAASIPASIAHVPAVLVKNVSNAASAGFNLTLSTTGYSQVVAVAGLAAGAQTSVTFPGWTPAPGSYTLTATSDLSDADGSNNTITKAVTANAATPIVGSKLYTFDASAEGWTAGGPDFTRSSSFTKLGGPYSGSSWVTKTSGVYTVAGAGGVGLNTVTSPFVDLSGLGGDGNVYISFYESINTEANWDRSFVQYTTDGSTWNHLGSLDDPNGVNWYSSSVYANAEVDPECFDETRAVIYGILYEPAGWSSNGDCHGSAEPEGPDGYVYHQLKITAANYPSIVGAPVVQFRYVAFSDAAASFNGWAMDNFFIGGTAPNLLPADIAGTVFEDMDGDGDALEGADAGLAGIDISLLYFGVELSSTTTDGNGAYSFTVSLPGDYELAIDADGYYAASGNTSVSYGGDGVDITRNFGFYEGGVFGTVYSDINNNGANNSDPGLSGWTVNLYEDSSTTLVTSTTSASDGTYGLTAGPGLYTVTITQQATGRPTGPGTTEETNKYLVNVSGTSGGAAVVTGKDFGQFIYGSLRIELTIDLDGDGVKDAGDVAGLPGTNLGTFVVTKDGDPYDTVTVGAASSNTTITGLDLGAYAVTQTPPAGWSQTGASGSTSYTLATSSRKDTARYLDFDHIDISGTKFNDTDGDGVKDEGEAGLSGWTINLSGTGGGSTTTDANGNYTFTEVGGGAHTLSETQQSGWTLTMPSSGSYTIAMLSGTNQTGKNFGNFQNVSISGTKYRDRNNNGDQDAGEEGLEGWTINLDGVTGDQSTTTDENGAYSFSNVGPGTYAISEVAQSGWTNTEPDGGTYSVTTASGSNVSGKDFGNFQDADESNLYFTFEASTLEASATAKDKVVKAGKGEPTIANILNQLISKTSVGTVVVGKAGQMLGGKEKRYIVPASFKDVQKTLVDKSGVHDGDPQGLGLDPKGKVMMKKAKSLPPAKADNVLIANQLALKINIALSDSGYTTEGFGDLIYSNETSDFDEWTVAEIAAYVDDIMTNWNTTDPAVYEDANDVVAELNDSFTGDFDTVATATAGVYNIAGIRTVTEVGFLRAPVGTPRVRPTVPPVTSIPDIYSLEQNYPNPFNPSTTIEFMLPTDAIVTLKIYNMLGQEVATVVDNEQIEAGEISYDFDASSLSSGVYLYRVVAQSLDANEDGVPANFTEVKKMTLIK